MRHKTGEFILTPVCGCAPVLEIETLTPLTRHSTQYILSVTECPFLGDWVSLSGDVQNRHRPLLPVRTSRGGGSDRVSKNIRISNTTSSAVTRDVVQWNQKTVFDHQVPIDCLVTIIIWPHNIAGGTHLSNRQSVWNQPFVRASIICFGTKLQMRSVWSWGLCTWIVSVCVQDMLMPTCEHGDKISFFVQTYKVFRLRCRLGLSQYVGTI